MELGGADLQSFRKSGHHGGAHFPGDGVYQQLLLCADAAADEDELRVEDMHHARKALGDLIRPVVQKRQDGGVACMGRLKDSAAILPLRVPGLCAPHQSGGCGVPLPAARRAAGAEHAIQRVGAEVSQLTPETQGINDIDFEFVHKLAAECPAKIIAEGHIHYPEQAVKALEAGAFALVVGGAITRPAEITARFTGAINAMHK